MLKYDLDESMYMFLCSTFELSFGIIALAMLTLTPLFRKLRTLFGVTGGGLPRRTAGGGTFVALQVIPRASLTQAKTDDGLANDMMRKEIIKVDEALMGKGSDHWAESCYKTDSR